MKFSFNISELLKDIFGYIPSRLIPLFAGFIIYPVYTRLFTPEDYGLYILVFQIIAMANELGMRWLRATSIRFASGSSDSKELSQIFSLSFVLEKITLCILIPIIFGLFWPFCKDKPVLYFFSMSFLVVYLNNGYLASIARSRRLVKVYSIYNSSRTILTFLVVLLLVRNFKIGATSIIIAMFFYELISLPLLFYNSAYGLIDFKFKWRNYKKHLKKFLRYALPMVPAALAGWAIRVGDRYLINYFINRDAVGVYSMSYDLTTRSIGSISSIFLLSGTPFLMMIYEKKGLIAFNVERKKYLRYFLIISIPACIGLSFLSKPLTDILFSERYQAGHLIIPWISFSSFIAGFQQVFQYKLFAEKRTGVTSFIIVICGILNFLLNLFLIPKYGIFGAGIATFISYFIQMFAIFFASRDRINEILKIRSFLNIALSSSGMFLYLCLYKKFFPLNNFSNIIFIIVSSCILYFFSLYIFKELTFKSFLKFRRK